MNIYSEPYTYEGQCCQWCECSGGGPVSVPGAAHGAAPYTGHAVAAALAVTVGGQRPLGHQLARAVSPEQEQGDILSLRLPLAFSYTQNQTPFGNKIWAFHVIFRL